MTDTKQEFTGGSGEEVSRNLAHLQKLSVKTARIDDVLDEVQTMTRIGSVRTEEESNAAVAVLEQIEPKCRTLSKLIRLADVYFELSAYVHFLRVAKKISSISPWRYQILKRVVTSHIALNDLESAAFYSHILALINYAAAKEKNCSEAQADEIDSNPPPEKKFSMPVEVVSTLSMDEAVRPIDSNNLVMSPDSDFAVLSYETYARGAPLRNNIGDEIQSLAATNLVGPVHSLVNRDRIDKANVEKKIILNGWFSHYTDAPQPVKQMAYSWPPHESLRPLFVAFHIADNAAPFLLNPAGLQYLKAQEPIGCRDRHTTELLQRNGIEAYFSGCLTLTLPERAAGGERDYVALCDLPPDVEATLSTQLDQAGLKPVIVRHFSDGFPADERARFAIAQTYLDFYAGARFVVTSRLHAALPCLAMRTPVLLVRDDPDNIRFQGLIELLNFELPSAILAQPERGLEYIDDVRCDHLMIRDALIKKVTEFRDTK